MKKLFRLLLITPLVAGVLFSSCKKKEDKQEDPAPVSSNMEILQGDISSNKTLDASKKYLIKGKVYVQAPYTLTIPAGTILFGDKTTQGTLIINRGAKIMAEGTASNPIVMTSNAPVGYKNRGDWGGLIMCGNATTNQGANVTIEGITAASGENGLYGAGANPAIENQNSGVVKFVRIEFAGIPLSDDNELNSLTMGGIGSGTTFENILVSYANDDAFEWFGGSANAKYLIAYSTLDDDFDTDRGFSGNVQYGLIVRDPDIADKSTSRGFECSSNNNAGATPHSSCKFANITILGPWCYTSDASSSNISNNYGSGVEINSNSNFELHNSVVIGWKTGVNMAGGANSKVVNSFVISNSVAEVSGANGTYEDNNNSASIQDLYGTSAFNKGTTAGSNATNSASPLYFRNPTPVLNTGSIAATGAPNLSSAGFETQAYYGAFGTAAAAGWHWGENWINFDPVNTAY